MNGSVIDTSVIIRMMNGDGAAVNLLRQITEKYVPVIVVGELFFGAYKSARRDANLEKLQGVLACFNELQVTGAVARSYATIKADLQKQGTPIPENDLWIAATARAYRLPVATFDEHFKRISLIEIISPDK
jgi:tRNA(fMet)-specific endonuclease VapC